MHLRDASRLLISNAGFTADSVLTLAMAIGVNTLLLTFFNAYVLKPLPLKDLRNSQSLNSAGRYFAIRSS
jgi:hypothetical protein